MNRTLYAALGAASILGIASASYAAVQAHDAHLAGVSTYKPDQGFNHTVSSKQFVGYFVTGNEACDVTVLIAEAGDEQGRVKAVKLSFGIPAAGRSEIMADNGQVLAMACTADADQLKLATLSPPVM